MARREHSDGGVGRRLSAGLAASLVVSLLAVSAVFAEGQAEPPARSPAELIPEGCRFFLELDLAALRDRGPAELVTRALTQLAPIASEAGLSAQRLRTVVLAHGDEPLTGDQLPSWLLLVQDGAAPLLSRLEAKLRRYSRAPLRPGRVHGIAYRGSRDLSLVELPGRTTLIAGPAGPRAIVEAAQGKGGTPLLRSPRAELLHRVSETAAPDNREHAERPEREPAPLSPTLRLWLALPLAMQRSLMDEARLPAAPLELAAALRMLPDRGAELSLLSRCSDEETGKRLAAWMTERLAVLASASEVQLLGLASYVRACKVRSDGALVWLELSLSSAELASVFERAMGLVSTLAPRG